MIPNDDERFSRLVASDQLRAFARRLLEEEPDPRRGARPVELYTELVVEGPARDAARRIALDLGYLGAGAFGFSGGGGDVT
jgi:hypothetical protein